MEIKKATFNLPIDEILALKDLAESEYKSVTEILRRAIKAELFISKVLNDGGKVLTKRKDGTTREIVRVIGNKTHI